MMVIMGMDLRFMEKVEELQLLLAEKERLKFLNLDHVVDDVLDIHVVLDLGNGFVNGSIASCL